MESPLHGAFRNYVARNPPDDHTMYYSFPLFCSKSTRCIIPCQYKVNIRVLLLENMLILSIYLFGRKIPPTGDFVVHGITLSWSF
jgi:hypothetical protein